MLNANIFIPDTGTNQVEASKKQTSGKQLNFQLAVYSLVTFFF